MDYVLSFGSVALPLLLHTSFGRVASMPVIWTPEGHQNRQKTKVDFNLTYQKIRHYSQNPDVQCCYGFYCVGKGG